MRDSPTFNSKAHLAMTWSAIPLIVFFFIGMVPMSGFIPPPSPMTPAAGIVTFYTSHLTSLRLGMVVSALSFTLMFGWGAVIAVWTARIEKGFPVLCYTQLVCCAAGSGLTFMIFLVWSVASFRPDIYRPEMILMFNDLGWFLFLWIVPPFSLWSVAMGWAILQDDSATPLYPRWTAFVCFWEALLMETTMLIALFKTGPFAFNGILGFWVPVIAFFIWMAVMTVYTHKAIMRHVAEDRATMDGRRPVGDGQGPAGYMAMGSSVGTARQ